MFEPLLNIENVAVSFHSATGITEAVKDVSYSVSRGETLAVVGESGSGKSVTARAIMGMLPPNAQVANNMRVFFDGEDLSSLPEIKLQALRGSRIAMIFQEPLTSLNPVYKIGEQVAEIITVHRSLSKKALLAEVVRLLTEVQLPDPETRIQQYPHEMSGDQRQRVMIAMALAKDPDLLIADEPTTTLDVTVQAEILALLKSLQRSNNMAILLITHDLTMVRCVSDNVVVMQHGEVIERGHTQSVFDNPQHPYTRSLINSEPKGLPDELAAKSPDIMTANNLRAPFDLKQGGISSSRLKDLVAANDVSAKIRQGKKLGIVGEKNSGKTTSAMALIKLANCQSGEIIPQNQRIKALNRVQMRPLRTHVQVVFQDPFSSLNPRMIIRQILEEGLIVKRIGEDKNKREKYIKNVLNDVHMPHDALDRFPHEFSAGQRQRLAIARAIVLNPELILLDEPASALDISIQAQIIELLRELCRKRGLSYLFISHDLKFVKALFHNTIVVQHGNVVEACPTSAVLTNPKTQYSQRLVKAAFDMLA